MAWEEKMTTANDKLLCSDDEEVGRYLEVRSYLSEGTKRGVEWLESQNTVLEEVDKLVELMATEKENMSREITKLKVKQNSMLRRENMLGTENQKLKLENINKQSMLVMQEEKSAKVAETLKEVLEATKRQLDEAKAEVDTLTNGLSKSKAECKMLVEANVELKAITKKCTSNCSELSTSLELLRTENLKLTSSLSNTREQYRKLLTDSNFVKAREKELEERLHISEDMILALRGRLTSAKKMEEQLKSKCAGLERALEAANSKPATVIVPNPEKTRVELELIRECKKKEEVLINYSNQLSACQAEQKKQRILKTKIERSLMAEKRKNIALTREIQSLKHELECEEKGMKESLLETKKNLRKALTDVRTAKKKELQFNTSKQEVEMALYRVEEELRKSKDELCDIKMDVEEKEGKWWEHKQKAEKEKLNLMMIHSREIERLREQLATCSVDDSRDHLLEEAHEDYRRLKEASAKRCTELAKEVWRLKSLVVDLQEHYTQDQ